MAPNFPQDALKDPLFIKWYRDEDGEKVSVSRLNEQQIVMGGHIYLNEIPDEFYRVQIDGYVEKQQGEVLVNNNDFIVNYTSGQLTFKSTEEAKTILKVFKGYIILQVDLYHHLCTKEYTAYIKAFDIYITQYNGYICVTIHLEFTFPH